MPTQPTDPPTEPTEPEPTDEPTQPPEPTEPTVPIAPEELPYLMGGEGTQASPLFYLCAADMQYDQSYFEELLGEKRSCGSCSRCARAMPCTPSCSASFR